MNNSDLPRGWCVTRLGDVVQNKVEQGEPGDTEVSYIDIGSIDRTRKTIGELASVNGATAPTRARQWVRAGDVLVSLTRPNLNAVAIVPPRLDGAVASTGFDILRAKGVLPDWLFSRVRSTQFVADVCEDLQGVVYPAIRPRNVREHQLPLPPLAEQHRIVEAIESYFTRLDEAVAGLERVQRNLERYRASVLQAAVEGRLVPTEAELARAEGRDYEPASVLLQRILGERRRRWEEAELAKLKASGKPPKDDRWKAKYEEPTAPDTSQLPELPAGWCWTSVHQLAFVSGGITKNTGRQEGLSLRAPYLRVANVYADELRLDEVKDIGIVPEELERYRLEAHDLLVVEGNGSIEQIGRVALWDGSIEPCLHQNHLIKVRMAMPDLAVWALRWLLSSPGRAQVTRAASSTSGLHTLSLSKVAALALPLAPLSEQQRVLLAVDQALSLSDAAALEAKHGAARCQRLRQSILKWAFEGKLVDQDPNDEPAEALLARVRAEREAEGAMKASGRRGAHRGSARA